MDEMNQTVVHKTVNADLYQNLVYQNDSESFGSTDNEYSKIQR